MIVPISSLQHTSKVALLVIPLILLVLLSTPAWLLWPFLSSDRRSAVLQFLEQLVEWVKILGQSPDKHEQGSLPASVES